MGEKPGQGRKEAWQCESLRTRMKRVKVYRLEDNGKWDDQGTGHVTIDYIEGSKDLALAVVDEEDNDTLLLHNITPDDIYRKQEETIISWRDPEKALELALSFQEAESCSFIWENMCTIQLELQSKILGSHEVRPQRALKSLEAPRDSLSRGKSLAFELPPLELSSLSVILETILQCDVAQQTHVADLILKDRDFFPKIVNLFRTCKGLGDMGGLHIIFRLVKAIILLNSAAIFDKIFSDDFILDIIGVLEYDPEVCNVQNHSAFLKEHAGFKEVIPIRNASVVSKIHQTYRICYIKDVILPKLDEATLASLNAIINANNAFVVCLLKDDTSFMQRLFATMRSSNISSESKKELVLFLREFCTISSSLQPAQRMQLSRDLASRGVFDIISDVLRSQEKVLVSAGIDILHYLTQDPNLLRSYIANHEENSREGISLLGLLIEGILTDFGGEMPCQFLEILKVLLDGCTADTVTQCRDFIELFYEKCFDKLIDIIESSRVEEYSAKPEILYNICELLCFCARHHPYKIKIAFFGSNSMEKILTLTRRRERSLVVAAVRIMRTIIGAGRNDELLISHVIEYNTLKPIIEVFVENGNRYNMLHSTVLELLDFIRKENLKSLVVYVVESFWDQLLMFGQLTSIQAFKLKYQEYVDIAEEMQTTSVDHTRNADERGLDKEEEDYFSKDSEEDSAAHTIHAHQQCLVKPANGSEIHHIPARPKSGGLVDNGVDKDYKSSPKRPVKADEALNTPMASYSSLDSKDADGNILKKPKLEDKQPPLSPASSIKNSDGNDDVGKASPGSPDQQQHALESLDSGHQTGDDCMKDAGDSSPEMALDTAKPTDSEPSTAG
ncbi:serine/threonine-protein phosphatase 4 regulatory subunit 3-like isoform X2 [Hordeum vulgare subsp. vulgare]|uniref:Serine/threonine-protein phosphatase 4 regulatory subunit 3-like central domain-containing protein n=1 Tax=Hordeum vulgare subsp. vulgare TaxID=112509 RepID=A0A8I6WRN4_HORVV|nr:serine/threonine-protein phosphatase 4 regulatory subunit 3-like isoform X2 [Hordeum vulgare subsp. vulgare]